MKNKGYLKQQKLYVRHLQHLEGQMDRELVEYSDKYFDAKKERKLIRKRIKAAKAEIRRES